MIKDIFDAYREAFRQWVRTRTTPKSILEAEEKRLFWSKCYLFSVLCFIGISLHHLSTDRAKYRTDISSTALRLAKGSSNETLKFIKFSGFKQVFSKTIDPKDIEKDTEIREKLSKPERR